MRKPIIGIISKQPLHHNVQRHNNSSMVRNEVKQAIIDHGGTPIGIVSPLPESFDRFSPSFTFTEPEAKLAKESLSLCHGLIFQGGSFISNYEIGIARLAHDLNLPVLSFGSGQTIIAHATDNITTARVDPKVHNLPDSDLAHSIIPTSDNTIFRSILNACPYGDFPHPLVGSRHNFSITSTTHLVVSATDPDGNCEAIEDPDCSFYLGLRFHPESLYKFHALSDQIFHAFITAAKTYQSKNS